MSKISTAIMCSLALASTSAFAILEEWEFKPMLGADIGMQNQRFDSGFGEEHFRKNYPATNFYLGTIFHKYLGMEVGYEHMYSQEKKQFYPGGAPVLGFTGTLVGDDRLYFSDVFVDGWNVNLIGYWPVCPKTRTEIIGVLGVSWLKAHYDTVAVSTTIPAEAIANWESDTHSVFRAGLGLRQMLTDSFGMRLQAIWEDSSRLNASVLVPSSQGGNGTDIYTASPKDSYIFNLGFFFQIP